MDKTYVHLAPHRHVKRVFVTKTAKLSNEALIETRSDIFLTQRKGECTGNYYIKLTHRCSAEHVHK